MTFFSRSIAAVVYLCGVIAGGGYVAPAAAQDQAKRPLRLLVPSPPGGPSDFAARLIAPKLSEALGQNVVVDNRQSVNGILATEIAAKSPADGNTLLIGNIGTMVMNTGLYKKLPYDPLRDFVPITQLVSAGTALVAKSKIHGEDVQRVRRRGEKGTRQDQHRGRRRKRRGRHRSPEVCGRH